jgi:hypothetical protein
LLLHRSGTLQVKGADGIFGTHTIYSRVVGQIAIPATVPPEFGVAPVPFPVVGYVDLRLFTFDYARGPDGEWVAADVECVDERRMPVRIADVVEVNVLAVPLRAPANYDVMQHELRLVLSYLPDDASGPLCLRRAEFKASSSHIGRFVTE